MRSVKISKKFVVTVLSIIAGGAISAPSAFASTGAPAPQPIVVEKKVVTIQDLLKQIQSGQGLGSCASTGNVLGASLTDVQVASLKQAGYTVTQKGDVYDVFSPKSVAAVCDVKSDSKSDAKIDAKIDAKTGDSSAWQQLSVDNQQKLSASGYNQVSFDGMSTSAQNKVKTEVGVSADNKSSAKTGPVDVNAGNSADSYFSRSTTDIGDHGTGFGVRVGVGINLSNVRGNACDFVTTPLGGMRGSGDLHGKNTAKNLRWALDRLNEILENPASTDAEMDKAEKLYARRLRAIKAQGVIFDENFVCRPGVPVTPPGNPPANPPVVPPTGNTPPPSVPPLTPPGKSIPPLG